MRKMTIEDLRIERKRYGSDKGKFSGVISFSSHHADIKFQLNDDHVQRIFELVIDRLYEVASEVSDELTADVIESMPNKELEHD